MSDVTHQISVVYGGNQAIDNDTGVVEVDLAFENRGAASFDGPLYIRLENVTSDFGELKVISGPGCRISGTDYYKVGGAPLAPGQTTAPYRFSFRFASVYQHPSQQYLMAKLAIRVFSEVSPSLSKRTR
jgi:hypothetical protein